MRITLIIPDMSPTRHLSKAASILCLVLGAFCVLIAFSNYRLFVEGTIDDHGQLIHEQWRVGSAKFYTLIACGVLVFPVIRLLRFRRVRSFTPSS
jgi:hypothetical protein